MDLTQRKQEVEAQLAKRLQQRQQIQDALYNVDKDIIGLQAILNELNTWADTIPLVE